MSAVCFVDAEVCQKTISGPAHRSQPSDEVRLRKMTFLNAKRHKIIVKCLDRECLLLNNGS